MNKAVPAAFLVSVLMTAQGTAQVLIPGPSSVQPYTATPIKHLVVIYGENESFDHYFGTYPLAKNPQGEPPFIPRFLTPPVNGLNLELLYNNPNKNNPANGAGAYNPFRLDRTQAVTADQDHDYTPEQLAFDDGKMDLFPKYTGVAGTGGTGAFNTTGLVLGYYDGNTATALWNYAQHFALSDNSYSSQFGPSTVGALNLVSGQTNGAIYYNGPTSGSAKIGADNSSVADDGQGGLTVMGDPDPFLDVCSLAQNGASDQTVEMLGKNIGDLLNAKNISWGWFQGGFDLTLNNATANNYPNTTYLPPALGGYYPGYPATPYYTGSTGSPQGGGPVGCVRQSISSILHAAGVSPSKDYVPHHAGFQYYASTRNPNHYTPYNGPAMSSLFGMIGTSADTCPKSGCPSNGSQANHQYDTHAFFDALSVGNLPSVTFLKAPKFQNAHPGNSDPLDEQVYTVNVINALQASPFWANTAVIIAYDDSDGWYDHANHVINPSFNSSVDALEGTGTCQQVPGSGGAGYLLPLPGPASGGAPVNGRCGYGPRLPLLVISPYAKHNFVDHTVTDQSSIIRFIEDNWLGGERIGMGSYDVVAGSLLNMFDFKQQPNATLILDPSTGLVTP
jgi:phospholipase C